MILYILSFFFLAQSVSGQTVTNGNFSNNTYGWGCNPEINQETVYGGNSGTNYVAEVDQEANLCQTISGFTPGATYKLKFLASRRTTCGPTLQIINVTISGGALSATVSRNGTSFSLAQESIQFTATASSQTLTFTSGTTGTCNMLIDNIQFQLISNLPVELTDFFAGAADKQVQLGWTTASELRNDHYTIERSSDNANWIAIGQVKGTGTTTQESNYSFTDAEPLNGLSYYRLSQTDLDGIYKELGIRSVMVSGGQALTAYPNPASDVLTVSGAEDGQEITILDAAGRSVPFSLTSVYYGTSVLDISGLPAGSYLVKTATGFFRFLKA